MMCTEREEEEQAAWAALDGDGDFSGASCYMHCWVPVSGCGGKRLSQEGWEAPSRSRLCLGSWWEGEGFFLSLLPGIRPFLVTIPAAADMASIGKNKHPGKKNKKKLKMMLL